MKQAVDRKTNPLKEYKAELQNYKQNSANLMNVVFEQHIAQIVRHEIQPSL